MTTNDDIATNNSKPLTFHRVMTPNNDIATNDKPLTFHRVMIPNDNITTNNTSL